MKRGAIVVAAERGTFSGKPRPWLVIQNSEMLEDASSITVCAISADAMAASFRVPLEPSSANGLDKPSLVLADKIITLRVESIVRLVGEIEQAAMHQVDAELRFWLDL